MFKNAKVGDRVWDFSKSWGIIEKICDDDYPIVVLFENKEIETFTFEGKYSCSDLYPRLFWNEIKFEIPEKPFNLKEFLRENLEPKEFEYEKSNYYLVWDSREEEFDYSYSSFHESITPYFKRENMQIVVDTLNRKSITFEDLKQAFKELGWI